ncbi:MAG: signal peptidase I [Acidobacteria bacterium]|nr:MAG: signal peptidase I [Acidobacteriota bacterium]REJ99616.1 MAG: signal peptidase I [Acidobacteriota bacterium]
MRGVRSYAIVLATAVILAVFVRTWLVQAFVVPSNSMAPTLAPGDHLLVNKFVFRAVMTTRLLPARRPRRGDVVVFRDPRQPSRLLVKRCLGLPGDRVDLVDKTLIINGLARDEAYAVYADDRIYPSSRFLEESLRPRDNFGPLWLGDRELFCLGDHRDVSLDSRHWGPVSMDSVIGRAALVFRRERASAAAEREGVAGEDGSGDGSAAPMPTRRRVPRWVR